MRPSDFSPSAFGISVTIALLAGCGGLQAPIGGVGAMPQASAPAERSSSTNYKIVYSFSGGSDGGGPAAGLIDVGGTLYGTTSYGGAYSSYCTQNYGYHGCGTVYSVTLSGSEKLLHSFRGGPNDGALPLAGLTDVGGTLYGTTYGGGKYACYTSNSYCGTVFSVTLSGAEKLLHSFRGDPDGASPWASLIDVKGTLYGTTDDGGPGECYYSGVACGTVFAITPTAARSEHIVHGFTGSPDGAFPRASLIELKGTLYGTTAGGGAHGSGEVFGITTGGKKKRLHSFDRTDGADPMAGLVALNGTLYGTTAGGGTFKGGTVFSVTPSGRERVLHSFGYETDGARPLAGLVALNGTLYGTTESGGSYTCGSEGCGTVFSITTDGTENVLHNFSYDEADGVNPDAGLIDVRGTLYGTTYGGGAYYDGTVFALRP